MNLRRQWTFSGALTAIALTLCYCSGGGGGGAGGGSTCPFTAYSGRALLNSSAGLNLGTDSADAPNLTELNGKIYIGWSEFIVADANDEVQVSVFNGNHSAPSWARVVGSANGLNKDTVGSVAAGIKLAAFNDKLYATWTEDAAGPSLQIRAAVYNGNDSAPSWAFVDGGGATGLNKSPAQFGNDPQLITFNSKLYLIWSETNAGLVSQIRAAVYNGDDGAPAWTFVDGNGANGLNKNTAQDAEAPVLAIYDSKLYVAWKESNGADTQARVAVYNGNDSSASWSMVDGNGTNGLNYSTSEDASQLKLISNARELVLFWVEPHGSGPAITAVRARVYNGLDNGPQWTFVDGGANGINANNSFSVEIAPPAAFFIGYTMVAGWMEDLGSGQSLRLAYYATGWNFLANSATANLNVDPDPAVSGFRPTVLVSNSCRAYVGWVEFDNILSTNRLHTAIFQ